MNIFERWYYSPQSNNQLKKDTRDYILKIQQTKGKYTFHITPIINKDFIPKHTSARPEDKL